MIDPVADAGKIGRPVLLTGVRPIGFTPGIPQAAVDILIGGNGRIESLGRGLPHSTDTEVIAGNGAYVSPGWCDLHVHVWHGGTDISIRPEQCGLKRGVVTLVDAGSAGEANFAGFREFVIEPARERILAFLNIGSIGLVACNRVSELIDVRSIDIDRTLACIEANRDVIRGIKVRASHVILGSWGITPVKIARKVARIARLPLMVHVGEPPPMLDEIFELLDPGDIVTHCFNGKAGGNILDDEQIFALAERCAGNGVVLDVGHGAASYAFRIAEVAISRGLMPRTISTDLHLRSLDRPVWDLATTMAKLMAAGMPFEEVVAGVTTRPMGVVGLPTDDLLALDRRAELTVFDVVEADLGIADSMGSARQLSRLIEPRWTIVGTAVVRASRHPTASSGRCPSCGAEG
ncbi:MAG TPA: amidohydrolase/deacetylase family metallohydrolase [Geminicoccaceae bacterium]|nr:amidohydrolase/deacetylase family metallohydrolase [Geminicoccus sp.]HMU51795.1 amidohydrolase/deacetylase family metallohydrolase [Geminicoccaceae bacterium]